MSSKPRSTPRRVGLQRETLAYGHLLQSLPKPREPTPEVDAPPIDSSDEAASPKLDDFSSGLSEIESPPPAKKRKGPIVRVPKSRARGSTSPEERSTNATDGYLDPSNIKRTTFTSNGRPGRQTGTGGIPMRKADETEEQDPFSAFNSSQLSKHKTKKTYGGYTNIHASAPSPKRAKPVKKSLPVIRRQGEDGFIMPDTAAAMAKRKCLRIPNGQHYTDVTVVDKQAGKKTSDGFKDPTKFCDITSPPRKSTRRSSRNLQVQDDSTNSFQPPPAFPSRLSDDAPGFVMPLKLSNGATTPKSAAVFKSPLENIPSVLGNLEFSESTQKAIDRLGESAIPTSSAASSSLTSLSNDAASLTSSLSSPPSSPYLEDLAEHHIFIDSSLPEYEPPIPDAHCPVCKESVPYALLESFIFDDTTARQNKRMTMRRQALFCRMHRTQKAHSDWKSRGYPTIDWPNLPKRLQRHHKVMEDILSGRQESYYRNVLDEKVKNGKTRTIVQDLMNLSEKAGSETGYYGSRGAKVMYVATIVHSVLFPDLSDV